MSKDQISINRKKMIYTSFVKEIEKLGLQAIELDDESGDPLELVISMCGFLKNQFNKQVQTQ